MTVKEYIEIYNKYPNPSCNESYHIHYDGEQEDYEKLIAYNKALIEKYPWLLPRNRWTDTVAEDYDYTYTELDGIPVGWRIAFGEQMCEEIDNALGDYRNEYCIAEIKEKYGMLRWYDFGASLEVYSVIRKYEELSTETCIACGAPATKMSKGWISPWCNNCADETEFTFENIGETND